MEKKMTKEQKLKQENKQLKKALCICFNKPLVKRLSEAMKRIEQGNYYTEEEFLRNTHLVTA